MATAKSLNESYQKFLECKDGNYGLEKLLEVVREHCLGQYHERQDAEDLAQDVLLSVWRNIHRFEQRSSFSTWLATITKSSLLWEVRDQEQYVCVGDSYDLALFLEHSK